MKAADLKNMSVEDLLAKITEEKAQLAKMKFGHSVAGTENPMLIRNKRRDIARMQTVLTEKKSK